MPLPALRALVAFKLTRSLHGYRVFLSYVLSYEINIASVKEVPRLFNKHYSFTLKNK